MSAVRLRRQHELSVQFGLLALRMHRVEDVVDEACRVAARGLNVKFAKVLKYLPEENCLLLIAGMGWDPAEIGTVRLGADDASPAGYAYASDRPVLSNHLSAEDRFRTPDLLLRYGIQRAINVPVRGVPEAYGVLEADSPDEDDFIESDIVFLEAIASVISMTRERLLSMDSSQQDELFSTNVLNASLDCISVLSPEGQIEFMNENGLNQMEIDEIALVQGKHWRELWPANETGKVAQAIDSALQGESTRFEAGGLTVKGTPRWWDVSVAPVRGPDGQVARIVAVARDISDRHRNEARLEALISSQESQLMSTELMMKEVHHRVRNSLQLIQTLLSLQANLAQDSTVKTQLQAAATRVMTIGSVHQRLYQDNGMEANDAALYLEGLIEDFKATFDDRDIRFQAASLILPAQRLAPLGLITSELVTNALKYGRGVIAVSLEPTAQGALLSVTDEGPGFPENFPEPQGTGLGMRLVRTYAGSGVDSVEVDRSVPYSRITVKFRT